MGVLALDENCFHGEVLVLVEAEVEQCVLVLVVVVEDWAEAEAEDLLAADEVHCVVVCSCLYFHEPPIDVLSL